MKYMILISHNPASQQVWESFTAAKRAEGWKYYASLNEDLNASSEMIISEALADPSLAKRVRVAEGQVMTTDGPFAEAKEHLAGFFLVDCESMDRAVEIAGQVPEAMFGLVEVRPVLQLGGADM